MNRTTEWKAVPLSKDIPEFSGAKKAYLEHDGNSFLSLTLILKDGRTVRIRKESYSVTIEEPIVPTKSVWVAKVGVLSTPFDTEEQANEAIKDLDGEVSEVKVPVSSNKLALSELPF